MADPPSEEDSGGAARHGAGMGPAPESPPGMPGWVKASGIAIGLLILLAVAVMLISGGHGPRRHGAISPAAAGAVEFAVTADGFAFHPDTITVTSGEHVAIALTSVDVPHDFTIDEFHGHVVAGRGQTAVGGFRAARPGEYVFYCAEPGHRQAGMEGLLIVEADG